VDFEDWKPLYEEILDDFGFDRTRDERSARFLDAQLEKSGSVEPEFFDGFIRERDVLVCGKAPTLESELVGVDTTPCVVIAADGATSTLLKLGMMPDVIVTDLDGDIVDLQEANRRGSYMVIHAHGDNIDLVKRMAPMFERVMGTTQASPTTYLHNFGGFTDGDRAVFFALHFQPSSVTLVGFDFDDVNVTPVKAKKLKWARRLIMLAFEESGMSR